jgi:hypothetical protein
LTTANDHIAAVAEQTLERLSGTPVNVECRDGTTVTIHVGKLYIDQLIALSQFARRAWAAFAATGGDGVMAEMKAAAVDAVLDTGQSAKAKAAAKAKAKAAMDAALVNVSASRVIEAFLAMLTVEEVGTLMGVLCDRPGPWCERNLGIEDIANVCAAVAEHNDPAVIWAGFHRAARGLRISLGKSAAPSTAPSP